MRGPLTRLKPIRPDVAVLGLEINPAPVAAAKSAEKPGLSFDRGGFELTGRRPAIVRAANVLRQYPEESVVESWSVMQRQLDTGGSFGPRQRWQAVQPY